MTLSVIPLRIGACMGRLFIILLCSGLMLAGCATDLPFLKDKKADEEGVSGAANQETEGEAEPLVYYVGVESLRLYEQPRTSGNFIADLEQHQKVYRYKIEKGFAWVKVDGTDMTGWVVNAKLIWRLPKPGAAEPVEQPPEAQRPPSDEAMDVNTQEGETAPTDSSEPRSQSVDPSKFDAF
jgi:hypothetical protein